jgi:hypothetical protein
MTSSLFLFYIKTIAPALDVHMALEDGTYSSVIENFHTYQILLESTYNFTDRYLCSQRKPGDNSTRDYYECDAMGRPSTYLLSGPFDPRQIEWYTQTKAKNGSLWVGPYITPSVKQPVIAFCLPLLFGGVFDGVMAVDFPLDLISSYLADQYNGTNRAVYVIDHTGVIVGTSTGINLLVNNSSMKYANDSGDEQLTRIMQSNPFQQLDSVYILDQLYVQATKLVDDTTSLDWWIIVTMPADPVKDYLLMSDAGAGGVIGISVVALIISLIALILFLYYCDTKIIRMSQRRLVGLFLLGCLMINCTFFIILTENTLFYCRLQTWWPNLWFTVAFSPILIKTWFMWAVFNKTKTVNILLGSPTPWTAQWVKAGFFSLTSRTFIPVIIMMLILLGGTLNGEMDPYQVTVLGTDSVYETHTKCGPNGTGVFDTIRSVFQAVMVLTGCVLAFATRQINSFLAESYSLAIIVYSLTIFGIMIYMILNIADLQVEAYLLLYAIGLCWSTSVSTVVLLGPRFLTLMTVGDEAAAAWLKNSAISTKHLTPTQAGSTGSQHGAGSQHAVSQHSRQSKTAPNDVSALDA